MRCVTAAEMREMDRLTIEERGVAGLTLMERAGAEASRVAEEMLGPAHARVAVLCGRGNNGGDGFVIARLLAAAGHAVRVLLAAPKEEIAGDAALALERMTAAGPDAVPVGEVDLATVLAESELVVDALLGTGTSGEIREPYRGLIEAINATARSVLAVDMPSGLHSDTGAPLGCAVLADVTVTFGLPKIGLLQYPGVTHAGRVVVGDIGIPEDILARAAAFMTEPADVAKLLPARRPEAHKGDAGRVLVIGGSPGLSGAPVLAARAACRAGAGLVTVAAPRTVCGSIEARTLESMTLPLDGSDGVLGEADLAPILEWLARTGGRVVLAIGPGLGRSPDTLATVCRLLAESEPPAVVDADGLYALAEGPVERRGELVLTPHPGEMAALMSPPPALGGRAREGGQTGMSAADIQSDRVGWARRAAEAYAATVVLKGARSVIASPDGRLAINPTGHPGMASGGMGDVLTGIVAALMAQGLGGFEAATAGAYLHGYAAELAAERLGGEIGIVAGDLIDELPRARAQLSATTRG